MKKIIFGFVLLCSFAVVFSLGVSHKEKKMLKLMVWHNYVEDMGEVFDNLLVEFNNTVGKKEGVVAVSATVANTSSLSEFLLASVKGDPGASEKPDMALIYPRTAVELVRLGALADLGTLFSKEELSRYVPEFLEEGMLGGDTLYVLPINKSTEVLYLNRTIFERFAREVGVDISQLSTFEGIRDAALRYYERTDGQTPLVPKDGKTFFYQEHLFNYFAVGFEQLGDAFAKDRKLNFGSPVFRKIWDIYFDAASRGQYAIFDKYSNYLAMTGDIVCATSSSAGAIFYPERVTYNDNTKEDVSFDCLPYPIFEGGERAAVQRGGGMVILKSDAERERTSAAFLKWLTASAQNLRLTAATGYMPVTKDAFNLATTSGIAQSDNPLVRRTLETVVAMQKEYRFYVPPVFEGFEEIQGKFVSRTRLAIENAYRKYETDIGNRLP
jgi:multiple sugar transport system substrate-binding protein